MPALHAIILGIIQGLTEFIPVSSSGHLIAVPQLLGWNYQGKTFDVAVHLGTLVAVVAFFWRDWLSMFSSFFAHVLKKRPYSKDEESRASGKLLIPLCVACIPAAIVGVKWDDLIEHTLSEWYFVAPALVVFGLLMLAADKLGKKKRDINEMNYTDYLTIGVAQAFALFPGVSRSGATITAGMFRNLDRAAAARFSFLLSTPVIFGAGMKAMKDILDTGMPASEMTAFALGFIAAAISGYAAIAFLINYLKKNSLSAFVIYRICLAAALVGVFVLRK